MSKHVVKKSKGKYVVTRKPTPPAPPAKTKGKEIKNIPDHPSKVTSHQSPISNNPTPPPLPAATQPVAVAPTRPNPFRKAAGVAQENN